MLPPLQVAAVSQLTVVNAASLLPSVALVAEIVSASQSSGLEPVFDGCGTRTPAFPAQWLAVLARRALPPSTALNPRRPIPAFAGQCDGDVRRLLVVHKRWWAGIGSEVNDRSLLVVAYGSTRLFFRTVNARRVANEDWQPREAGFRNHLLEFVTEGDSVVRNFAVSKAFPPVVLEARSLIDYLLQRLVSCRFAERLLWPLLVRA